MYTMTYLVPSVETANVYLYSAGKIWVMVAEALHSVRDVITTIREEGGKFNTKCKNTDTLKKSCKNAISK